MRADVHLRGERYVGELNQQRQRRDRYRAAGLCPTCGGPRDRAGCLNCEACYQRIARSKARRYGRPWPVAVARPAAVVHPRWHLPLKGQIAMELFYGLRRKVA